MIKIGVSMNNQNGTVIYNETEKIINVDFPDDTIKDMIEEYLATKRSYKIPKSQEIDDYEEIRAFPNEDKTYFDLAISTMTANIGVMFDYYEID